MYDEKLIPIFQKIILNKNARLQPDSLKTVVSRVRVLQKRGDPTGCSYNPNAIIKDSDLALEQVKRREYEFNQNLEKELSKLNTKNFNSRKKSQDIEESLFSPKANLLKTLDNKRKKFNSFYHQSNQGRISPTRLCERDLTPGPRDEISRYCKSELNHYNVKQVDKLVQDCSNFKIEMKKIKGIHNYIEAESLEGKVHLEEFLTGKKVEAEIESEGLKIDDKFGFDVKMTTTCARKRKIWKMNHVSFITTVDRMMNSLPLIKK
jgi:hypothetical protein